MRDPIPKETPVHAPEEDKVTTVTLSEISSLFKHLFPNRRTDGRLCVGALPNKAELKEAEAFHARGEPVPRRLKPWWQFYSPGDSASFARFVNSVGTTRGVHMRQSRFEKTATRGLRENVVEATHVWVDIDVKHHVDLYKRQRPELDSLPALIQHAEKLLKNFQYRPTAIVWSGGGLHAYWALKESIIDKSRFGWVEDVNRSLARVFGGDEQAVSINDPLRLPGTCNFNYTPVRRCVLASVEPVYHDLRDMLDTLVQLPAMFGPGEFDDGTASIVDRMAAELGGGRKLGKGRKTEAEWAKVIRDLSSDGNRHGAALSLCGKLSHMGLNKSQMIEVLKQNGCTLTNMEMDQIASYAETRREEGRAA